MLIDAAGYRHVTATETPRIVSLVPSLTELLFALDLRNNIVGRTNFCIEPEDHVASVPVVGGTKTFDVGDILALRPTHVLVNIDETPKKLAKQIQTNKIPLVVTHPNKPSDNIALFSLLGGLFSRQQQAAKLTADLQGELMTTGQWPERKVLYLIWKRPWMTVSRDTYIANMLALFGMHTLGHEARRRYPKIDINSELLFEADFIFFATEPFPFAAKHIDEFAKEFSVSPSSKLRSIDGKMVSWYGNRVIEGLSYLREFASQLED